MLWSLASALGGLCLPAAADTQEEPQDQETFIREGVQEPAEEAGELVDAGDLKLDLQFAIRFNLFHKSWNAGPEKDGARFDTIMLGVDASYKQVFTSVQYRFYDGYNMLHHGYVGYRFDDTSEIQIGVTQKPFGLLPYASHNYFFNLTYYVGLEDDYDLGAKFLLDRGPFELQCAFFFRDEGNYFGNSIDSARYSYDVVKSGPSELGAVGVTMPRTNQERNQFDLRLAWTFEHGEECSTQIGCSGEWGQLLNGTTGRSGYHWAAAAFLNGDYGPFNLQFQVTRFSNRPENPPGQDSSFVIRGAYDAPYKVAAEGWLFLADIAYEVPIKIPLFDTVTLYTDYSYLFKNDSAFRDSQQLVVGSSWAAGPALIFVDFAFGRNHSWLGPDYSNALAEGGPDGEWELRFNINVGFYF